MVVVATSIVAKEKKSVDMAKATEIKTAATDATTMEGAEREAMAADTTAK